MKGYNGWSYAPYRPLINEVGDIYICRVVPYGYKSGCFSPRYKLYDFPQN